MSFIIVERQSYIELPEELWDKIEQIKGRERARSSKSYQSNVFYTNQPSGRE